ncbi:MAG TPA: DinB family protein [Polyangia bacterium]|nr:DinB family protein [Polyangia bacterium]
MFTGTYALLMAEYNRWMNRKVYAACGTLSDEERRRDRGAFFKSIHATLDHILGGDGGWMARFTGKSYPVRAPGALLHEDFEELRVARVAMDQEILTWARALTPADLAEPMTWTAKLYGFTQTHPRWVQVVQMFNHQTHHRGQVHALLTAAGIDVGPTDVPVLPLLNAGTA